MTNDHQRTLSTDSTQSSKKWWKSTANFFTKNSSKSNANQNKPAVDIYEKPPIPPIFNLDHQCQLHLLKHFTVSELLKMKSVSRELRHWVNMEEVWEWRLISMQKTPSKETNIQSQVQELYQGHQYELQQLKLNQHNRDISLFKVKNRWEMGGDDYDNYEDMIRQIIQLENILRVRWNNETNEMKLYLKSMKLHFKMELMKTMEVNYNMDDNYGLKRCMLILNQFEFDHGYWSFIQLNPVWINWSFTPPEYKLYRQLDTVMQYVDQFFDYYQNQLIEQLKFHNDLNLQSDSITINLNTHLIDTFLNSCIMDYTRILVGDLNEHLQNPPQHHPFPIPTSAMSELINKLFVRYNKLMEDCLKLEYPIDYQHMKISFIKHWSPMIHWQCLYELHSHRYHLTQSIDNWINTQLSALTPANVASNSSNFWLFGKVVQKTKITLPTIPKTLFQFPAMTQKTHQPIGQDSRNDIDETLFDLDTEMSKHDNVNLIDWDAPSPQPMAKHMSLSNNMHEQASLMDMDFDPFDNTPQTESSLIDIPVSSTPMNKTAKSSNSGQSEIIVDENSPDFPKFISYPLAEDIFTTTLKGLERLTATSRLDFSEASKDILSNTVERLTVQWLQLLGEKFLFIGLERAFKTLKPLLSSLAQISEANESQVVPNYFRLMGKVDSISNRVERFFEEQLTDWFDFGDFVHPCNVSKKSWQTWVDDWVTNSLDEMIKVVMNQTVNILTKNQSKGDFLPAGLDSLQPTKACVSCIDYLTSIFQLLQNNFQDSKTLAVIKDEIMTRLFTLLTDHIKKFTINPSGGYRLLSDISAYHHFCNQYLHNAGETESLRQFDALKEIPNLFLIDEPATLKSLVQEEGRYLGVFFIPDLLEFLNCRTDIKQIRPMIEQEGCSIM